MCYVLAFLGGQSGKPIYGQPDGGMIYSDVCGVPLTHTGCGTGLEPGFVCPDNNEVKKDFWV